MQALLLLPLLLATPQDSLGPAVTRVPGEAWMRYADVEQAGFSAEGLAEAEAFYDTLGAAGAMVIHDGAVLAAWGDVERRYMCHSVRKSFMSAMYGILDDRGELDLETAIGDIGIDDLEPGLTDVEKGATIMNLLEARSGVYRLAAYEPPQNPKPERHAYAPGEYWCYNNWDFNALVTIYDQQTGRKFFEDFGRRIAAPLGMQDYRPSDGYYHYELDKSIHPAYPFRMSARDMARFGLLYLNRGHWAGEQVVSEQWVARSQAPISKAWGNDHYGLLWWISGDEPFRELGMYSARGSGGHAIDVIPGMNLVLAFRVNTYAFGRVPPQRRLELLEKIIAAQVDAADPEAELVPLEPQLPAPLSIVEVADAQRYVGEYVEADGTQHEVVLDPTLGLMVVANNFGTYRLFAVGDDRFEVEDLDSQVLLEFDAQGRPAGVVIEWVLQLEVMEHLEFGRTAEARAAAELQAATFPTSPRAQRNLARTE